MTGVATQRTTTKIARPLKVLIPLIKVELAEADAAGLEHYRQAGAMLNEAKEQLTHGSWARWLSKNFELSDRTAKRYMRLARLDEEAGDSNSASRGRSLYAAIGEPRFQTRAAWKDVFKAADKVDVDYFKQERQSREDEVVMRRKLALELIGLGYKALAIRHHPDRGGSRDAMARLNEVRAELTEIAQTRRFV